MAGTFVEIVRVKAPVDHVQVDGFGPCPVAVNVQELPGQMLAGTLVIVKVGCATVTVAVLTIEHPALFEIIHEQVVVIEGETEIDVVVAPVDQLYVFVPPGPPARTLIVCGFPPIHVLILAGFI